MLLNPHHYFDNSSKRVRAIMASDSKTKTGNVTLSQLPTEIFHNIIGYV